MGSVPAACSGSGDLDISRFGCCNIQEISASVACKAVSVAFLSITTIHEMYLYPKLFSYDRQLFS